MVGTPATVPNRLVAARFCELICAVSRGVDGAAGAISTWSGTVARPHGRYVQESLRPLSIFKHLHKCYGRVNLESREQSG
ncbi:uncharacterized protein RMCB_0075 [Mycolicibacterium brisbanense]|uniref:Uncharacterized protein n=1 Tax=Mycolicibacterium brisbanense TaxID=146020 RepID=A0A100VUB3_9MYCO|nr:uncharacterized protein RMCB_0075 [Mycolicibacterium brisbanense]